MRSKALGGGKYLLRVPYSFAYPDLADISAADGACYDVNDVFLVTVKGGKLDDMRWVGLYSIKDGYPSADAYDAVPQKTQEMLIQVAEFEYLLIGGIFDGDFESERITYSGYEYVQAKSFKSLAQLKAAAGKFLSADLIKKYEAEQDTKFIEQDGKLYYRLVPTEGYWFDFQAYNCKLSEDKAGTQKYELRVAVDSMGQTCCILTIKDGKLVKKEWVELDISLADPFV
ncbi:MAG: hypothetical protein LBT21_04580 [Oscillospiraceae bacterium]|nr:hypothetical protein [Oscillospiraceae bacterium]